MSTQPCGCDPTYMWTDGTKGWRCQYHQQLYQNALRYAENQAGIYGSGIVIAATPGTDAKIGVGGAPTRATTLPEDPAERKKYPVASGVLNYFPDALVAVAHVSWRGNEQHSPGQPLHWARGKSADQDDTIIRHFLQRGTIDTDGLRHSAKLAWRALAALQIEIEKERESCGSM